MINTWPSRITYKSNKEIKTGKRQRHGNINNFEAVKKSLAKPQKTHRESNATKSTIITTIGKHRYTK